MGEESRRRKGGRRIRKEKEKEEEGERGGKIDQSEEVKEARRSERKA